MSTEARYERVTLEVEALHDHFRSALATERRNRLVFLIVGLLLVALVFGYMAWLHGQVKKTVTPREIAEFVTNQSVAMLPALGDELSQALREAAPALIDELERQLLDEALPELRKFGEKQLLDLSGEAITVAEQQMVATVSAVIKHNKAAILADATSESTISPNALAQSLDLALQSELKRRLSDRPGESLSQQLDSSRKQLRAIHGKLQRLSNPDGLTRVEHLERRLLQSWTAFLDQQAQDL